MQRKESGETWAPGLGRGGARCGAAQVAVRACAPGKCRCRPPGRGHRQCPGGVWAEGEGGGPPVHKDTVCCWGRVSGLGDEHWRLNSVGVLTQPSP